MTDILFTTPDKCMEIFEYMYIFSIIKLMKFLKKCYQYVKAAVKYGFQHPLIAMLKKV